MLAFQVKVRHSRLGDGRKVEISGLPLWIVIRMATGYNRRYCV